MSSKKAGKKATKKIIKSATKKSSAKPSSAKPPSAKKATAKSAKPLVKKAAAKIAKIATVVEKVVKPKLSLVPELTGDDALVAKVIRRLRERDETVSFAESCTGGLLSSMIASMPGASEVFVGAVVAYDNTVKNEILGVADALLRSIGAVSIPVARKMAAGVRKSLGSSWSVSITGIAGPGGGTPAKPVGTVCLALCGPGVDLHEQQLFDGERREIQRASAIRALELLNEAMGDS